MKRVFAYLLLAGGLLSSAPGNDLEKRPTIIAPEPLVQEWVEHIASKTLTVRSTYQPDKGEAVLFLELGLERTPEKPHTPRIILSDGLPLLKQGQKLRPKSCANLKGPKKPCCCNTAKPSTRYEAVFSPQLLDAPLHPYAWMDVSLAMSMIVSLTETLCDLAPEQATFYKKNSQAYLEKLEQLDLQLFKSTNQLPRSSRKEPNASWRYFTRRYGLELGGNHDTETLPKLSIGEQTYIETMEAYALSLENKGPEA